MATESKSLIIVESPSKIKTLKKFLGNEYQIEASVGHIRDLPKKNLGIDLENNFAPKYEVSDKSKQVVKNLKSVLKGVDTIYIATDPDRDCRYRKTDSFVRGSFYFVAGAGAKRNGPGDERLYQFVLRTTAE